MIRLLKRAWPWWVACALPSVVVALLFHAWRTWLRVAPVYRQGEAPERVLAYVVREHGREVAGYLLPAPPLLASFAVVSWTLVPVLLALVWTPRASLGHGLRLGGMLAVPFLLATVASASLPEALPFSMQLGWGASLWARTLLYATPFFALFACFRRRRWVALALVSSWLVSALLPAARVLPQQLPRLLMRIEPANVALGVVLALAWSALFSLLVRSVSRASGAPLPGVSSMQGNAKAIALALCVATSAVLFASPAFAYSKPGHFAITDAAWQVMRANASAVGSEVGFSQLLVAPSGISQSEWNAFRDEVTAAQKKLLDFPNDVPNDTTADRLQCFPNATRSTSLRQLDTALGSEHHQLMTNHCVVDAEYAPAGAYGQIQSSVGGAKAGTVLGYHAKNRDDDLAETRVEILPIVGTAIEAGSAGWTAASAALVAPFVCAYKLVAQLWGETGNCWDDAKAIAEKTNLMHAILEVIPGFNVARSELYIGFWHHVNVRESGLSNEFDDRQGLYMVEGGPAGKPGALDFVITIAAELGHVTLNPRESAGIARYAVENSADGHAATKHRSSAEWGAHPFPTMAFSPLDNLAYGGYNLAGLGRMERLGWPLHALGDATVPMHTTATPAWGHEPYETWVENHVEQLTYARCEFNTNCLQTQWPQQVAQAQRVMAIAYRWRTYLRTHGIRDLVTALAQQTFAKAGGDDTSAWAWCDSCSIYSNIKLEGLANFGADAASQVRAWDDKYDPSLFTKDPRTYYDQHLEKVRSLVEDAMGAKIAFLTWASQQG